MDTPDRAAKQYSRGLTRTKNIRPKLTPSDTVVGDVLESRPVLGSDERLVMQPLRDGLLTNGGPLHIAGDAIRESCLAARDGDGATKRGNVRFLHDYRDSTTRVVKVNNPERMTDNNMACSVIRMPSPKRKSSQRLALPERNRELSYDPKTYGGRFNLAVRAREMAMGREMTQAEIVEAIQRAVGRTMEDPLLVSQQTLSKIRQGKQDECADTPAIAIVLGVAPMWLAYGIGSPSLVDEISRQFAQK